MILTIDIGNSNIVLAIFEKDKIVKKWRIITEKSKSKEEYSMIIQQIMKVEGLNIEAITGTIISSVVPEINEIFKASLNFIKSKIIMIGEKNIKTNIKMKKSIERVVGSDILMNVLGGIQKFKENFIIIDMGTATTFDIVVKDGEYIGSIIVPGVKPSLNSLYQTCSQLPLVELKKPKELIGNTTKDIIQSGIYYGYIGIIKEITSRIKEEYKNINFTIHLTGGLSSIFIPDLEFIDGICDDLTLEGLNIAWHLNNK